jgi:hypothetical protein
MEMKVKLRKIEEHDDRPAVLERMENKKQTQTESICQEADKLVNKDRQETYGHPYRNFRETADLWNVILGRKLQPGVFLTPEDIGLCMIAVKLARQVNLPKRDNLVDIAGYAKTLDMCDEYKREKLEELVQISEEVKGYSELDEELYPEEDECIPSPHRGQKYSHKSRHTGEYACSPEYAAKRRIRADNEDEDEDFYREDSSHLPNARDTTPNPIRV